MVPVSRAQRMHLSLMASLEPGLKARCVTAEATVAELTRLAGFAAELEADAAYPAEYVAFRVMGERQGTSSADLLVGVAIRRDLMVLMERLAADGGVGAAEMVARGWILRGALAEKLKASAKTIERLREVGLLGMRVRGVGGRRVLVFERGSVDRVMQAQGERLARLPRFARMTAEERRRLVRWGERYRARLGWSISAAAKRLSERTGRSHEAIRQVLLKAQARTPGAGPVEGTIDQRRRRVLGRAVRLGIDPGVMARKWRRSRGAVRRALALAQAEMIWDLVERGALRGPTAPTFELPEAADVLLAPAPVRTGLGSAGPTDLLDLVRSTDVRQPPLAHEETSRLVAMHYLRFAASRGAKALDRLHPSPGAVDEIEVMLLHAARLKVELIRAELRTIRATLTARLTAALAAGEGRGEGAAEALERVPPLVLARVLGAAIQAAGAAVDGFDPFRGGRLAAAVGLACDRAAVEVLRGSSPASGSRRAAVILARGTPVPDWTRSVCPWQKWLEIDARVRQAVERGLVLREHSAWIRDRFGLAGAPPMTLAAMASRAGLTASRARVKEQEAVLAAWRAVRGG